MSIEEDTLKGVYSAFCDKLTYDDFKERLSLLNIDKMNFLRATRLFQQSLKCRNCSHNISITLLISCADSIKLKHKSPKENILMFYVKYCPQSLRIPPMRYSIEPYSPIGLEVFDRKERVDKGIVMFEEAILYIYHKFRNSFVHEGFNHLAQTNDNISDIFPDLLFRSKNNTLKDSLTPENKKGEIFCAIYLTSDMDKILGWFSKVTIESLFALLESEKT